MNYELTLQLKLRRSFARSLVHQVSVCLFALLFASSIIASEVKELVKESIPGTDVHQVFTLAEQLGVKNSDKNLGWVPEWIEDANRWRIIYVNLESIKAQGGTQMGSTNHGAELDSSVNSRLNLLDWAPVESIRIRLFDDVGVTLKINSIQASSFFDPSDPQDYRTWYAEAVVQGGWGTVLTQANPDLANMPNVVGLAGSDDGWVRIDHMLVNGLVYRIRPITDYSPNRHMKMFPLVVAEFDPTKPRENGFANDLVNEVRTLEETRTAQEQYEAYEELFVSVPYWMNLDEQTREALLLQARIRLGLEEAQPGKGELK